MSGESVWLAPGTSRLEWRARLWPRGFFRVLYRSGSRRAKPDNGSDERVDVADVSAMIDDGRADRELAVQNRCRWRGDPGFLDIDDDKGFQATAA